MWIQATSSTDNPAILKVPIRASNEHPPWPGDEPLEAAIVEFSVPWNLRGALTPIDFQLPSIALIMLNPMTVTKSFLANVKASCRFPPFPLSQFEIYDQMKKSLGHKVRIDYHSDSDKFVFKMLKEFGKKQPNLWLHQRVAQYFFGPQGPSSDEIFFLEFLMGKDLYYVLTPQDWPEDSIADTVFYNYLATRGPLADFVNWKQSSVAALVSPDACLPEKTPLALFTVPQERNYHIRRNKKILHYSPPLLRYFPLKISGLPSISFQLVDPLRGSLVEFGGGVTSFIKLKFRKRSSFWQSSMQNSSIFHLTSQKGASPHLEMKFETPLELHSAVQWEMAITHLILPSHFLSPLQSLKDREIECYIGGPDYQDINKYVVQLPMSYLSIYDLAKQFENQTNYELKVLVQNEKLAFQKSTSPITLRLNENTGLFLGMSQSFLDQKEKVSSLQRQIKLKENENWILPFSPQIVTERPLFIKIFCGEVEPVLFNGKLESLLRTVPLTKVDGSYFNYEFSHLEYRTLLHNRLNRLSLTLLDPQDKPLPLDRERAGDVVHATVVIRPRAM